MEVTAADGADPDMVEATRWYFQQAAYGAGGIEQVYLPEFTNVRTDRAGGRLVVSRADMLSVFEQVYQSGTMLPGGSIRLASAEVVGDLGFVLFSRDKPRMDRDAEGRHETVAYTFVWRHVDGRWRLLREFSAHEYLPEFDQGDQASRQEPQFR